MRLRNLFFIGFAAAALFAACDETDNTVEGNPSITVTPDALEEFSAEAGEAETQTVTVTSNRDWIATPSADWIKVNPSSGSASDEPVTVTIYVETNTIAARTGSVEFNAGLVSDEVEISQAGSSEVTYTTVAQIRELATEKTETGGLLEGENLVINVVVVSDTDLANYALTQSMAMVQDETAGVQLDFDSQNTYSIGDELVIDLTGAHYEYYNNLLQVQADAAKTTVLTEGVEVTPVEVTVEELLTGAYESQYVAIKDVQVVDGDLGKKLASATSRTSITLEGRDGDTFLISHAKSTNADLCAKDVPQGSGTLKGIASVYGSDIQIVLAKLTDTDEMTGERFASELPTYVWTLGTSAYTQAAVVNGTEKDVLKLGTGEHGGDATITVPSGTKSMTFYAVSWKSKPSELTFSGVDGIDPATVSPAANDGASSNPPYTITVTDTDQYTVTFASALSTETQIKVESSGRNILWDFEFAE